MSDQQITCAECGNIFVFSAAEQQFYSERGLAAPPKRCKACRQARRASQDGGNGGGRGGARDSRGRNDRSGGAERGGPRSNGNPNEYRSPMSSGSRFGGAGGSGGSMSGGGSNGYRGASAGGAPNGRFSPRPSWGERGNGSTPQGGAPGRPSFGGGFREGGGGDCGARGNRPARFDGGGFNDARPQQGQGRGAPAQAERGSAWGTRPNEGGQRPPRAPRGKDRLPNTNAGAVRETKPNERPPGTRPERPRYDITCGECGTQAQVPFKPLEGRQVFCQPCYRARKGPPAEEATTSEDSDTGIVE